MSKSDEIKAGIAGAMLFLVFLFVLGAIAFVGFLLLYYAKIREDELIKKGMPPESPLLIATGITLVVYFGSAAGALLSIPFENPSIICEVVKVGPNCSMDYVKKRMPIPLYMGMLFVNHALWFWLELTCALYAVWFGIRKQDALNMLTSPRGIMLARGTNAGVLAGSFAAGNTVAGYMKYEKLGCDARGPVCNFALTTTVEGPLGFIISKIATVIDAWLILPVTIVSSFGNQFKLTELCPLLFCGWALYRFHQSGHLGIWLDKRGATISNQTRGITLAASESMHRHWSAWLVVTSLALCGISFWIALKVLP